MCNPTSAAESSGMMGNQEIHPVAASPAGLTFPPEAGKLL